MISCDRYLHRVSIANDKVITYLTFPFRFAFRTRTFTKKSASSDETDRFVALLLPTKKSQQVLGDPLSYPIPLSFHRHRPIFLCIPAKASCSCRNDSSYYSILLPSQWAANRWQVNRSPPKREHGGRRATFQGNGNEKMLTPGHLVEPSSRQFEQWPQWGREQAGKR